MAVRRQRSTQTQETGRRSDAGWVGSCDAGKAAGSGCGFVGDGAVAADVAAVDGVAVSVGVAAGVGAGNSAMR